ncbi:peptide chain release factor N(5)-glutamine methyltransferase [Chitinivorax sp. PXF-14]|uniref:peptide chain release factor N(5)-glutamine methyltransferase n=1 Tax=Chitinivorax sp. PXF-14 TaxID=3230488 RepID=UPI00346777CD
MPSYRDLLRHSGLDAIDARALLCHALGVDHAWLIAHGLDSVPAGQLACFDSLAERRRQGEPVAYIVGEREFYSRPFHVTPEVLIPRPETEHLVELALARLPLDRAASVLDLGTGSGIIAITIALERPRASVLAVDASPTALAVAADNARRLGASMETRLGNWYSTIEPVRRFELIVSNPPYIVSDDPHLREGDLRFEPVSALTDHADGLSCIRQIVAGAVRHLAPGGWLMFEHGYDQGAASRALLTAQGFAGVRTECDLAGIERVTLGCLESRPPL